MTSKPIFLEDIHLYSWEVTKTDYSYLKNYTIKSEEDFVLIIDFPLQHEFNFNINKRELSYFDIITEIYNSFFNLYQNEKEFKPYVKFQDLTLYAIFIENNTITLGVD